MQGEFPGMMELSSVNELCAKKNNLDNKTITCLSLLWSVQIFCLISTCQWNLRLLRLGGMWDSWDISAREKQTNKFGNWGYFPVAIIQQNADLASLRLLWHFPYLTIMFSFYLQLSKLVNSSV